MTVEPAVLRLPADLGRRVEATVEEWRAGEKVRRLWARDAALWTGADEDRWLGWLTVVDDQLARLDALRRFAAEVAEEGFTDLLLLGMGGSSLCPEVLKQTFGRSAGHPELHVLDSTDPAQVLEYEGRIDPRRTLVIVSSKSGTTLEPSILMEHFLARARAAASGGALAGRRFVAVTDPGSALETRARAEGFRAVFHGVPTIGGRFSALSDFGMVPAAAMGVDVARLLAGAQAMARACAPGVPAAENPGLVLGAVLGVLAGAGRDKATFVASPGIRSLELWLEQLLAESTGKGGKGLIPVAGEVLSGPEVYGGDRLFVHLRSATGNDPEQDRTAERLAAAGQAVVRIEVPEPYALGQELFRWEFATAVAGSILGVNPFDQPDVEASKVETRRLTDAYEASGSLPAEPALAAAGEVSLHADPANAAALAAAAPEPSVRGYLEAHLGRLRAGDYCALLAYLHATPEHHRELEGVRHAVRDRKRVATCLGYGPRFLHSTGQAYKGGPPTGVFLQLTCDDARDLPVPGRKLSFGVVKAAQARGDFEVLAQRSRRALRVHLGADVAAGLATLRRLVGEALAGTASPAP